MHATSSNQTLTDCRQRYFKHFLSYVRKQKLPDYFKKIPFWFILFFIVLFICRFVSDAPKTSPINVLIVIVTHKNANISPKELKMRWSCLLDNIETDYTYDFRIFDADQDLTHSSINGKYVTLPTLDGYHDLPKKIRHIRKYALEKIKNFHCLLKVDDDVFLDLNSIDNWLRHQDYCSTSQEYLYASHDMSPGPVATNGKWANKEYSQRSKYFPKFGHGPSYILGYNVVRWMEWLQSQTPETLFETKGEDVHVGIMAQLLKDINYQTWDSSWTKSEYSHETGENTWKKFITANNKCKQMIEVVEEI